MHMEYGSRVGVWRLARMVDEYGIDVSIDAPARRARAQPRVLRLDPRANARRDRPRLPLDRGFAHDARGGARLHAARVESIERTTGQRVQGWIVRSFPSVNTRELLVEDGGFLYDSDSTNDELPVLRDHARSAVSRRAVLQGLQRRPLPDRTAPTRPRGTSSRTSSSRWISWSTRPPRATEAA